MNRVIIVGGGVAGLTAAAYLAKSGYTPLLLEKEPNCGGLVTCFTRDGFTYDGGIRATEDSGILFPMIRQLGLDIDFVKNELSLGLVDKVIHIESTESLDEYGRLLEEFYPENRKDIEAITQLMDKIMGYMEVQYSIENPAFLDPMKDTQYFIRKIIPWMFKYVLTVPKIGKLNVPVNQLLEKYTDNQSLIDIITQHFFTDTPAFFALSYLKIYLDYHYPLGGTGRLTESLEEYIHEKGGQIKTGTDVTAIHAGERYLMDAQGARYDYEQLIWAADQKTLYKELNTDTLDINQVQRIEERKQLLEDKIGNDSVFTLYLAVDLPPTYFSEISHGHFFYTPETQGESSIGEPPVKGNKEQITRWLAEFSRKTTYEISIPVLKDASMAPENQTGLIISTLFDYHLTKHIHEQGWYQEFRETHMNNIITTLANTIYPGIGEKVIHKFTSTPITIEEKTGNTHGAITGWSFLNNPMPAESRLPKIFSSTETPIPDVIQAGQWSYSPSGLPISILTGKLASDKVIERLKKSRRSK